MPSVQLCKQAVPDCKSIVIVVRFLSGDLGKTSLEVWKDEVLDQSIEVNNLVYKLPLILRCSVLPQHKASQVLLSVHSNMFVINNHIHVNHSIFYGSRSVPILQALIGLRSDPFHLPKLDCRSDPDQIQIQNFH